MHWCPDDLRIIAMLTGRCETECVYRAIRYRVLRLKWWYEGHTELQKRDLIYGAIWVLTIILLSL